MVFINEWKARQTGITRNEIAFFRFLAELLSETFPGVNYYEVHGVLGQVTFNSTLWPQTSPLQKEIGDLIIIVYSYNPHGARYTIHQNKYDHSNGIQRTFPTYSFRADMQQYDLLAFRPEIKPVHGIKFPPGILKDTDYDSVASYGVFYEGEGHLIDFVYSIARWLTPQSYRKTGKLILNTQQSGFLVSGKELICSVGIENFLSGLLEMKIGAPIVDRTTGGFLHKLIEHAASVTGQEAPVIDLPPFIGRELEELEPISGGYRLLLINRDKIPNK